MSELNHQKILPNKPKKSQRTSNVNSTGLDPAAASFVKNNSASVKTGAKQPVRHRLRNAALTGVLALNAIIVGYTLFRKQMSKAVREETIEESMAESKHLDHEKGAHTPLVVTGKQQLSKDEQQKLFRWMLEELRRKAPADKAEKAQLDAKKAILKDFLKGDRVL